MEQSTRRRWIIVANESAAEFYVRDIESRELIQVCTLENTVARKKSGELTSDRAGRSFDSFGQGRHAMSKSDSTKDTAVSRFANELVDRIVKEDQQGRVRDYTVIAAPRFLGTVRKALQKHAIDDPVLTISKDVIGHDKAEIDRMIASA